MSNDTYLQGSKKHLLDAAVQLLLLLLLLAMQPVCAATPDILIITNSETAHYQRFRTALTANIAQSVKPGDPVHIQSVFLDNGKLSQASIFPGIDLIITFGSAAARAVTGLDISTPVLNTLIPLSTYRSIEQAQPTCRQQSAIFIDQPISRQVALARLMFPQRNKYGLLLGPVSAKRRHEIEALQTSTRVKLDVRELGRDDSTMATGRELLDVSDLVVAVNDPLVLGRENAKWLLYAAYQQNKPVIGFSRAYVKAGAAAAVFSRPEQIAQQAVELVSAWYTSGTSCLPGPVFTRYFSVAVNRAVSESLGSAVVDENALAQQILENEQP